MAKFHDFHSLFGTGNIMTVQEYQAFVATGKVSGSAIFGFIGHVEKYGGPRKIEKKFYDLNLEWYKQGGPIIEATDQIVDASIQTALAVLKGNQAHGSATPNVPALGFVFPTKSGLPYGMPSCMIGAHKNGVYDTFSTDQMSNGMFFNSCIYEKSFFSNVSYVEKNVLSGIPAYFPELFLFGLLLQPAIANPCHILRDQNTALGRDWNGIV